MPHPPIKKILLLLLFLSSNIASANESEESSEQTDAPLDEVVVHGEAIGKQVIEYDALAAVHHVDLEDLMRRQPNDIFEALEQAPGLVIEGGLRTRGKSFSIRGFSDNEDVLVIVDGVAQNFEKYRSGTSIEIETELLKEIAVFRGGAAVNQGAGYIGGAIVVESKDASDFLLEGQTIGANIKTGWHSNNESQRYLFNAYARPTANTDFIISGAYRETNDFHLPNGDSVPDSAEDKVSGLTKFEYYHDDFDVALSYRLSDGEAREPFDVQNGSAGLFGTVRRSSDERATTLRLHWHPDGEWNRQSWVDTRLTIGKIDKEQIDIGGKLASIDGTDGCPPGDDGEPDYDNPVCGWDLFNFDVLSTHISNTFYFEMGSTDNKLELGAQYVDEQRQSLRNYRDNNATALDFSDDFLRPTINNPNQPPGKKTTTAFYFDYSLQWNAWKLAVGARHDDIVIAPDDAGTQTLLALRGSGNELEFSKTTPSAELSWNVDHGSMFYRYRENFRPPLSDELFSRDLVNEENRTEISSFLNFCRTFSVFLDPPGGNPPTSDDPEYQPPTPENIARLMADRAAFDAAVDDFYANTSPELLRENSFCGDLYVAETSQTRETGFLLNLNSIFDLGWRKAEFKTTYFDIHTENLVESIEEVNGQVIQPGEEQRYGYEVELALDQGRWFTDINYSDVRGFELGLLEDGVTLGRFPLNNPPAASFNITAGLRFFDSDLQLGLKSRIVSSRLVNNASLVGRARDRTDLVNISGYHTEQFFAQWYAGESLNINLTIDNLLNETFRLRGFQGAEGEIAPGRDFRVSVDWRF